MMRTNSSVSHVQDQRLKVPLPHSANPSQAGLRRHAGRGRKVHLYPHSLKSPLGKARPGRSTIPGQAGPCFQACPLNPQRHQKQSPLTDRLRYRGQKLEFLCLPLAQLNVGVSPHLRRTQEECGGWSILPLMAQVGTEVSSFSGRDTARRPDSCGQPGFLLIHVSLTPTPSHPVGQQSEGTPLISTLCVLEELTRTASPVSPTQGTTGRSSGHVLKAAPPRRARTAVPILGSKDQWRSSRGGCTCAESLVQCG